MRVVRLSPAIGILPPTIVCGLCPALNPKPNPDVNCKRLPGSESCLLLNPAAHSGFERTRCTGQRRRHNPQRDDARPDQSEDGREACHTLPSTLRLHSFPAFAQDPHTWSCALLRELSRASPACTRRGVVPPGPPRFSQPPSPLISPGRTDLRRIQ